MSRIYGDYGGRQDTDTDNVSRKSSKLLVHIHNSLFLDVQRSKSTDMYCISLKKWKKYQH